MDPAPYRCSAASAAAHEPLAGTAPTDRAWLLVEHAGPWGRKALEEARLPDEVRARLGALDARVVLVRRHGRSAPGGGLLVAAARLGSYAASGAAVGAVTVAAPEDLLDLPLGAAPSGAAGWADPGDLALTCTNGARDLCCADLGRPVAAALDAALADVAGAAAWEATHLGGHRFAPTLLHLPSGVALGRLDAGSAVRAVEDLRAGRWPDAALLRGRAGIDPPAQAAEVAVVARRQAGGEVVRLDEVRATGPGEADGAVAVVPVLDRGSLVEVVVEQRPGDVRRQSCADPEGKAKAAVEQHVVEVRSAG